MRLHRSALVADFHRFYGLSLSQIKEWGIPLPEIGDMASNLPLDSATRRALDPHWRRTPELDMLREIEYGIRVLGWQRTRLAQRGMNYPERMRLPWDPEPEGTIKGDRMSTEDWDKELGWDKLKAEGKFR